MNLTMKYVDWGLIDYREANQRQLELVEQVAADPTKETIVFCSHPAVVTVGRATKPGDLIGWSGDVVEVSRGGRATYHGPSQVVVYPILNLQQAHSQFGERDLHGYMRALERAIVETLAHFDILSEARTQTIDDGPSLTGVWVQARGAESSLAADKKIASIGVACRKWVTYHGVALNVLHDPLAFTGIYPCGMQSNVMTSMEQVLNRPVDASGVTSTLQQVMVNMFSRLPEDLVSLPSHLSSVIRLERC